MTSYGALFWAYNLIWAVIAGYLLHLILRLRGVDRRLAALEREADRAQPER